MAAQTDQDDRIVGVIMPVDFLELPPHVVEYVLSCLGKDLRALLRCRLVCPQMNNMLFNERLDFLWKKMEIVQIPENASDQDRDKALSFLAFLPNVADYVEHLKFRARLEVPVANLRSFPFLPTLETLDLSMNGWLDMPHLQELAQKCDIINVNLQCCRNLSSSALAIMSNNWTRMESINMSYCGKLSDGHLSQFHLSLNALKKYNIEGIGHITNFTVFCLLFRHGVAERMTELRLDGYRLTDVSVIGTCSNMKFLVLGSCFGLTDATLNALKNLAALKHLHLTYGDRFITADGLEEFFQNASFQLQHLTLGDLPTLNDRAMEQVLLRNQGLKSLSLRRSPHITDTGLQHLRGLSQLRLLSLFNMKGVSCVIFNFDADMLPELRFIDLHYTISQTDVDRIRKKFPPALVAYQDWSIYEQLKCQSQLKDMEGACCVDMDR